MFLKHYKTVECINEKVYMRLIDNIFDNSKQNTSRKS